MSWAILSNERPLKAKSSVNASMMDLLAHDGKYFHESGLVLSLFLKTTIVFHDT